MKFANLKGEIAKKGDNLESLAKLLDCSIATVHNKLEGKTEWSLREIKILCDYFKKDYYELFN